MKQVSIDNGYHFYSAEDAIETIMENDLWDALAIMMEDDTREQIANELAPCTELEFLTEYLKRAKHDLIIG